MSVDVSKIIEVTADVMNIGTAVMGVLLVIKSKDLIKDFFIGLIYGDPNDPSNYIQSNKGD